MMVESLDSPQSQDSGLAEEYPDNISIVENLKEVNKCLYINNDVRL